MSGAPRAPVGLRELGDELGTARALQPQLALELADVFAFEAHDLERLARGRVALERFQNAEQKALDPRKRIGPVGAQQREIDLIDHGHGHLLAHREEQLVLIGEMPVDRPARDAGRGGDLLERRAGHSLTGENPACCGEDPLPGALRILFCSTQVGDAASLAYIRDCILYSPARIKFSDEKETISAWPPFTLGRTSATTTAC